MRVDSRHSRTPRLRVCFVQIPKSTTVPHKHWYPERRSRLRKMGPEISVEERLCLGDSRDARLSLHFQFSTLDLGPISNPQFERPFHY